ncbi:hypothetical protein QBC34DRAFT_184431 [Podospora aff. communis PSN243]|uniref:DNA/RNA-binding domain-containing protein n=1 Tax=Podospora aff. communis PSN243 TaxID=3040156 RepID=A0AAV9G7R7_9PEZI|nr:hypothetical protein QBC34DRAFT_184431 [Podospora aff. communis PSN243]
MSGETEAPGAAGVALKRGKDIHTSWSEYLRRSSKKPQAASNAPSSPPTSQEWKIPPNLLTAKDSRRGAPHISVYIVSIKKTPGVRFPVLSGGKGAPSRSASLPKHSKARSPESGPEFDRGPLRRARGSAKGRLWNPDEDSAPPRPTSYDKSNITVKHRIRSLSRLHSCPVRQSPARPLGEDYSTKLIKQPETRPGPQEQLVAEVKSIYAGLVMVENKCIEVDSAQKTRPGDAKLNNEQWQALIALHRTLLHEHHDFFLASQHPSASTALRQLASKYAVPARMWHHGIHFFLEALRHRLPTSLAHMLTFIYLADSMMALLYETVPGLEDMWIESLGDLNRYRMAIEDENTGDYEVWTDVSREWYMGREVWTDVSRRWYSDREVWTSVSRGWYSKASEKAPSMGRLYHHLAILARPNALQQVLCFTGSLYQSIPFQSVEDLSLENYPMTKQTHPPGSCAHVGGGVDETPRLPKLSSRAFRTLHLGLVSRILRLLLPFFMISASLAIDAHHTRDPWHVTKVLLLGTSAMGSFGTGMASLNLDMANPSTRGGPGEMSLRVVSSVLVATLLVAYPFWFLKKARKTRRFISGMVCTGAFWVMVRLLRGMSTSDKRVDTKSDYIWLDELILLGCIATVVGILNAERGIFSSSENDRVEDDEGDEGCQDGIGGTESPGDNRQSNSDRAGGSSGGFVTELAGIAASAASTTSQLVGA